MSSMTRRGLALSAAAAGLALSARATAQPAPAGDDLIARGAALVDPELRGPLANHAAFTFPSVPVSELPALRKKIPLVFPKRLDAPAVTEKTIQGGPGAPSMKVFLIDGRKAPGPRPAILHIHGGGYIAGWVEHDLPNLQRIAAEQGCLIVSAEYRLSPETAFPGPLEDNYAALRWLFTNARELEVDPKRVVVMGESAGGGHAASLALLARDRGEYKLAGQVLVFPMLDDRTGTTRTPPRHQGGFFWTPELNRLGWTAYLGRPAGGADVPAAAVPARAASVAGLPPTFIGVGGLDLFLQEDVAYAQRLMDAGVGVELLVVPGAYHAFQMMVPEATVSRRFKAAIDAALARYLRA